MRFFACAGKLYERVAGNPIERDPHELRRQSEAWFREAVALEYTDFPRAKLYATSAAEAQFALSIWEQHHEAQWGRRPFTDEGSAAVA